MLGEKVEIYLIYLQNPSNPGIKRIEIEHDSKITHVHDYKPCENLPKRS